MFKEFSNKFSSCHTTLVYSSILSGSDARFTAPVLTDRDSEIIPPKRVLGL